MKRNDPNLRAFMVISYVGSKATAGMRQTQERASKPIMVRQAALQSSEMT